MSPLASSNFFPSLLLFFLLLHVTLQQALLSLLSFFPPLALSSFTCIALFLSLHLSFHMRMATAGYASAAVCMERVAFGDESARRWSRSGGPSPVMDFPPITFLSRYPFLSSSASLFRCHACNHPVVLFFFHSFLLFSFPKQFPWNAGAVGYEGPACLHATW